MSIILTGGGISGIYNLGDGINGSDGASSSDVNDGNPGGNDNPGNPGVTILVMDIIQSFQKMGLR